MIKPYIYGGVALLIVGLFSYSLVLSTKLDLKETELTSHKERITNLETENKDLLASSARKTGAASAYIAMTTHINALTKDASGIIKGYKLRVEENEKCLDMRPPASMLERLRENYIPRQNN